MQYFNGKDHDPNDVLKRISTWMRANSNLPLADSAHVVSGVEMNLIFGFCYVAFNGRGFGAGAVGALNRMQWWSKDAEDYLTKRTLPYYVMAVDLEIFRNNGLMLEILKGFQIAIHTGVRGQEHDVDEEEKSRSQYRVGKMLAEFAQHSASKKIEASPYG